MTYKYIIFNEKEIKDEEITPEMVNEFLSKIKFVVTSYGTMYDKNEIVVEEGHRGVKLTNKKSLNYDWIYNILGGYGIDNGK